MKIFSSSSQIVQIEPIDLPGQLIKTPALNQEAQFTASPSEALKEVSPGIAPQEKLALSEAGSSEKGEASPNLPLVENPVKPNSGKNPLQAMVQGEKPVVKATTEIVGNIVNQVVTGGAAEPVQVPAEAAAAVDASLDTPAPQAVPPAPKPVQVAPAEQTKKKAAEMPAKPVEAKTSPDAKAPDEGKPSEEAKNTVPEQPAAPVHEEVLTQSDAIVKGTLLTLQAIKNKSLAEPEPVPVAPQPLLKGMAVSTIVPMISSGKDNLQAVISGEKTVTQAVGAVTSDALGAVVMSTASNLGQKLASSAATAMGAPAGTAEAAGMVAAFASSRLSTLALEGSGAKIVVMDQTTNWLEKNIIGGQPAEATNIENPTPEPADLAPELKPVATE
ncbi:hypothetical protein COW36_18630 [bacterium (Candidatus Blackallbacteria) CG17_big_fil_post_rev_8_21_14_2_50_48_46]|uniref:Uncharacterized protein n=1 Tax=bacterium (Candidatus Blackallbacteria) CG17_big_fil_post_rev_8_21_14_2_50_48_46 TaxID=2014261 RepID=A0A2M7G252_9BACT|nr:MAG: hypothetical protein COW64_00105 [bacterium (Candidatus Blackallbacteria) CG18_big_fil_WC_8_21_14_2_50_49_26]PIW15430.1 MAG: hypothetical protein COW36_18630 [bacterium (Candidatus Blackallbacteria) CG17_big_fil_post_rev_8_21_14_2_50_48_46]PIW49709.1 MAG: hypothetical protein COW20_04735 [bacterium (Candidatus Blackallbacteria) CG13_big_fil_rev_8_21_14_2_50_49_14]